MDILTYYESDGSASTAKVAEMYDEDGEITKDTSEASTVMIQIIAGTSEGEMFLIKLHERGAIPFETMH